MSKNANPRLGKVRLAKAKSVMVKSTKMRPVAKKATKVRAIKTRTSLKGVYIYPASVEPSSRVKRIVAALTGEADAA